MVAPHGAKPVFQASRPYYGRDPVQAGHTKYQDASCTIWHCTEKQGDDDYGNKIVATEELYYEALAVEREMIEEGLRPDLFVDSWRVVVARYCASRITAVIPRRREIDPGDVALVRGFIRKAARAGCRHDAVDSCFWRADKWLRDKYFLAAGDYAPQWSSETPPKAETVERAAQRGNVDFIALALMFAAIFCVLAAGAFVVDLAIDLASFALASIAPLTARHSTGEALLARFKIDETSIDTLFADFESHNPGNRTPMFRWCDVICARFDCADICRRANRGDEEAAAEFVKIVDGVADLARGRAGVNAIRALAGNYLFVRMAYTKIRCDKERDELKAWIFGKAGMGRAKENRRKHRGWILTLPNSDGSPYYEIRFASEAEARNEARARHIKQDIDYEPFAGGKTDLQVAMKLARRAGFHKCDVREAAQPYGD